MFEQTLCFFLLQALLFYYKSLECNVPLRCLLFDPTITNTRLRAWHLRCFEREKRRYFTFSCRTKISVVLLKGSVKFLTGNRSVPWIERYLTPFSVLLYSLQARVDPTSNIEGGSISLMFGRQISWRLRYCKRDEVFFTILLCRTMHDRMALYRE